MQIQVNTDHIIHGREKLADEVRTAVDSALNHVVGRITRVEVHLSDENGEKSGVDDIRCLMEARIEGRQPTVVTHHASTTEQAVHGAAHKLKRSVESTLQRIRDQHQH